MIAIILGQGNLAKEIIQSFEKKGTPFVCLGFDHFIPDYINDIECTLKILPLGAIGGSLDFFKQQNIKKIVFAGAIKRPNLLSLSVDNVGKEWIKKIGLSLFKGDDGLLSSLTKLLEAEGFEIISPKELLERLTLPIGLLTKVRPSQIDETDIKKGIQILMHMSDLDIGQAVVIENGIVLGIEAIEGTEQLIKRMPSLKRTDINGTLIKMTKVNQSTKVDLPTIGPKTVEDCFHAGLKGIAFDSKGTQVLEHEDVITLANKYGLFLKSF